MSTVPIHHRQPYTLLLTPVQAVHAIGGIIGNLCTGLFAADYITHLDGYTVTAGGWLNRHWVQLPIQLCASVAGLVYTFVVSVVTLFGISVVGRAVPALRLRVDKEEEEMGIDDVEIGEFACDYVQLTRDVRSRVAMSRV